MKLLESKKFELPKLFFITNKEEIKELPIGVPFILGDEKIEPYLVKVLEYEILYQNAVKTGFPFDFQQILKDEGYLDLIEWYYDNPVYLDYTTEEEKDIDFEFNKATTPGIKEFIKDSSVYVSIEKLKSLNIFPTWNPIIEDAVTTNLHNFAMYDTNMYNKKLEGMYGALVFTPPKRNLIIIDISGSIPKGVSSTTLVFCKNLAENFYCDVLITGTISTLYLYEDLYKLDIETIYDDNGMNNDDTHFRKLIFEQYKEYNTVIGFGDGHTHLSNWTSGYTISEEDCKKKNKWNVEKIISFHTTDHTKLAGYCRGFNVEKHNITHIKDWTKYLNK